jgi:hypothetical protein
MKRPFFELQHALLIVLLASWPSSAQTEPASHRWSHGTTLAASGGVGTASDNTGPVLGATIGWEITPRVGLDGTATWLDKQPGANAFAASLTVHAILTETHPLSPFIEGGFGLYLAEFDPNRVDTIPAFYGDRLSGPGTQTFTDPAFFAGGGFDIYRNRSFAIRPSLGVVIAVDSSRSHTIGTFTIRAEYHFEEHPVTPR